MSKGKNVVVLSVNCQGLRTYSKRIDVLNYLKEKNPDILCLQDTHWLNSDIQEIKKIWEGECILHGNRSNSRGVAILLGKNFEYELGEIKNDELGNMISVRLKLDTFSLKLMNVYGPNKDSPVFYNNIGDCIASSQESYVLLCGDLNLTLDPKKDCYNYSTINNPKSRKVVLNSMENFNLIDIFREMHPDTLRYTWRRKNPLQQARLDYFLASSALADIVDKCDIVPGYRTDHSIMRLELIVSEFKQGKGIWKLNTSFLKNQDYLSVINKAIRDEIYKYALRIYNLKFLETDYLENAQLTINDSLFLETLLLRLRGESIKFSSQFKKTRLVREKFLVEEIKNLEKSRNISAVINLLEDKKEELESIRSEKIRGHMIRCRTKWLLEGEKPSKFFCALENRRYTEKIIKSIRHDDGSVTTNQSKILTEIKSFYETLFDNYDHKLVNKNLEEILEPYGCNKLTAEQSKSLEGELSLKELGNALKNMNHGKTPGIDGFPAEFFKVFWPYLKHIIKRTLNTSFKNGELPLTLRQCIVSCLPKGNKDRSILKNWRPISLLSVPYKIASAAIASRLKTVLDYLVDKTQTGFIAGRYIGHSTRLVYDIMHCTEKNRLDGLLMLIDFAKAYDSISWKFLYDVLQYFGFGGQFINWIKLFNTNIQAAILQCGILSSFFNIKRGCRQGDPCAPFLFLLCGQILSFLITNKKELKGIILGLNEYKITQFADDTTIIMDGSQSSLEAALNTIETFGSMSGLVMNTSKTKIIWIGRKRYSKDKLNVKSRLEWGITEFNMLGIEFNVDLEKMPKINYEIAISRSKHLLNKWEHRHLTPFGKITIIKTFVISKFNHLFISLPSPDSMTIREISDMLFKFVWGGKPDKIARRQICRPYIDGGLKMINLQKYIFALKSTWIRRLNTDQNAPWSHLAKFILGSFSYITNFGPIWYENIPLKVKNPFWLDVLISWQNVVETSSEKCPQDVLYTPLWFNKKISQLPLYYPKWYKRGIIFVGDVLDQQGNFCTVHELRKSFKLNPINILEYYRIKKLVQTYIGKFESFSTMVKKIGPGRPSHLNIILKNRRGASDMYKILNNSDFQPKMKLNWSVECGQDIEENKWKQIFKVCFKFSSDASLTWFQYRILFRIIGVRKYLKITHIEESSVCRLCIDSEETISHLFYNCNKSKEFWKNISDWIRIKLELLWSFDLEQVIFGYLLHDKNFEPINLLILTAKLYIFRCAKNFKTLNIYQFQKKFQSIFAEQITLLKLKEIGKNMSLQNWLSWEPLFENI